MKDFENCNPHGHSPSRLVRKTNTHQEASFFYIASEGFTEVNYFEIVKNKYDSFNLDVRRLIRFDQESGKSRPRSIMKSVIDYRHAVETGEYSVYLFAGDIIQQLYGLLVEEDKQKRDMVIRSSDDEGRIERIKYLFKERWNNLKKKLYAVEKEIISVLITDDEICREKMIIDKIDGTITCREFLQEYGYEKEMCDRIKVPKEIKRESYNKDRDRFFLVFDRDRKCWDRDCCEKYNTIIDDCINNGISPYVSNPSFEFWLIMHDDNMLKKIDENMMLRNEIEIDGVVHHYAEYILDKNLECGYSKVMDLKSIFSKEPRTIDRAMQNATSYAQKPEDLESNIGSNINQLIEIIEKESKKTRIHRI